MEAFRARGPMAAASTLCRVQQTSSSPGRLQIIMYSYPMDGSCYAFLFSAQDYPKTPLASTRLDSKKMQQVLSRRDFEVEEFPNVSGQQLTVEIEKIRGTEFTNPSCILIYWSGHGDGDALLAMDEEDPNGKILYR